MEKKEQAKQTAQTEKSAQWGDDYRSNVDLADRVLRVDQSFDLIRKTLQIGQDELTFYYLDGFVKDGAMQKLMIYLLSLKSLSDGERELLHGEAAATAFCRRHLPYVETDVCGDLDLCVQMLLSGASLVLGSTFGAFAILIDSRSYPARSTEEPSGDRVMRGARDGFVETLLFNTALIRRRIRDTALTMRCLTVGTATKTDVVLCYMQGRADAAYVEKLWKKLGEIRTDSLTLGHASLAECLIKRGWYNPFPKIRYTERPDAAAAQLLEGSVLILTDNSPDVMILPTSVFDFMQETNDFYFSPLTGGYIRLLRHAVFWLTLFLTPIWYLLVRNPQLVPTPLLFILPADRGALPILVQLLLTEFIIDGLRMASLNTPDTLSNSLSVVGGLILGEFAVQIGWLIPEVILYMAFVTVANFTQRSYELGYAFKFLRILLLVLIACLNYVGFFVGLGLIVLLLCTNQTVDGAHRYLYPLIPFNGKALLSLFIRKRKKESSQRHK